MSLVKAAEEDPEIVKERKSAFFNDMRQMMKQPNDIIGSAM